MLKLQACIGISGSGFARIILKCACLACLLLSMDSQKFKGVVKPFTDFQVRESPPHAGLGRLEQLKHNLS
jgi:hypothetical protein